MARYGAYVGRFCPMHFGHEAVGKDMIGQVGVENSLMIIGSSNAPFSLRYLFSYEDRQGFARKIFPRIKMAGLPDYPTDKEWLAALDCLLDINGFDPQKVMFFGGCEEDLRFFLDADRKCHIMNRFDGTTPRISATEVRDCLIHSRSIEGMVNPLIAEDVKTLFEEKWERLKSIQKEEQS